VYDYERLNRTPKDTSKVGRKRIIGETRPLLQPVCLQLFFYVRDLRKERGKVIEQKSIRPIFVVAA